MKIKKILSLLFFCHSLIFCHTPWLQHNIYKRPKIHVIPKIIHQIWVGDKPIPEKYLQFMTTWVNLHPEWEYKLWTDKDVDSFPWKSKETFLKAKNPAMKADLWRIEIIYEYGGVYVDCDMECIRPLDPIHERLDGYFGFDSPHHHIIANSLIAAKQKHHIISNILEKITSNVKNIKNVDTCVNINNLPDFAGPYALTRIMGKFKKNLNKLNTVIFPYQYFQPVGCGLSGVPRTTTERDNVKNKCFAVHHNGTSWISPEFFPNELK